VEVEVAVVAPSPVMVLVGEAELSFFGIQIHMH
jgi:hypothetical protein